jgi:hypothetical protein
MAALPDKADAPLPIDADGVLTLSVAVQRVQVVSWDGAQLIQSFGSMERVQPPLGDPYQVGGKPLGGDQLENLFGTVISP